jgi:hypothetical protein
MVIHVNELCKFILNKFPIGGDVLPLIVEYRLSNLIRHVLWYELFVLLDPKAVKVDILKMFRVRSFFLYACHFVACGHINKMGEMIKDMHLGFSNCKNTRPHTMDLYYFYC